MVLVCPVPRRTQEICSVGGGRWGQGPTLIGGVLWDLRDSLRAAGNWGVGTGHHGCGDEINPGVLNLSYFHIEDARITISDDAVESPNGSLCDCVVECGRYGTRKPPV